jgi:hypothetical protein
MPPCHVVRLCHGHSAIRNLCNLLLCPADLWPRPTAASEELEGGQGLKNMHLLTKNKQGSRVRGRDSS